MPHSNQSVQECLRRATHAGSWYSGDAAKLRKELAANLERAAVSGGASPASTRKQVSGKAVIVPHAGYKYSGLTAAYGFATLNPNATRAFVFGPCHHEYTEGCSLPHQGLTGYETPLGPLPIDMACVAELRANHPKAFRTFMVQQDEEEHSIEMQLPYIREVYKDVQDFKIVPIYVGVTDLNLQRMYGGIFAPYLEDPQTVFIISSDFCHWGHNYRYLHHRKPCDTVSDGIRELDQSGIDLILAKDSSGFARYLSDEGNTICGRYPIHVFLETLLACKWDAKLKLEHYSQSGSIPANPSKSDNSVSYAAISCTISHRH